MLDLLGFNMLWEKLRTCDLHVLCEQVHNILSELVMGGMVLETNMTEIMTRIEEQNKLEKQEVISTCQLLCRPNACQTTGEMAHRLSEATCI